MYAQETQPLPLTPPPLPLYPIQEAINTAEITKSDLRKAREAANLPRWRAAQELAVSEDTLKRWEDPTEKAMPTSTDVSRMEKAYGAPGLWHSWMYSNDEGFRDHIPPADVMTLQSSVLQYYSEQSEMLPHLAQLIREAVDGKVDDRAYLRQLIQQLSELLGAGHALMINLRKQQDTPA